MPSPESADRGSAEGQRATIAAFLANLGIAVAKFVAFFATGAASMLAEAVHSVADTGNQGLLLWGRHRARRPPNAVHPFGFGRERYFWSLVVALVLFSAGGLFALVEGEEKLRHPHEISSYAWAAGVLIVAAALESMSLRTAVHEARAEKRPDEGWLAYIRRSKTPELAVVLLEDTGALVGLAFALTGVTLAEMTGNTRFDALGSLAIGVLLVLIALTLAIEMKSLLIGEAASADDVRLIGEVLGECEGIARVVDLRTEQLGPGDIFVVGTVAVRDADVPGALAAAHDAITSRVPAARLVYLQPVVDEQEATAVAVDRQRSTE